MWMGARVDQEDAIAGRQKNRVRAGVMEKEVKVIGDPLEFWGALRGGSSSRQSYAGKDNEGAREPRHSTSSQAVSGQQADHPALSCSGGQCLTIATVLGSRKPRQTRQR